jgi:hypothetical protein
VAYGECSGGFAVVELADTFDSARKVYEQLTPKPPPEPPRIAAARQLLENNPPEARDQIGAELIRQARDADEVDTLHGIVCDTLADDDGRDEDELV